MFVYRYNNKNTIRVFWDKSNTYYFNMYDLSKIFKVSRPYISALAKKINAKKVKIQGDMSYCNYISLDMIKDIKYRNNGFLKKFKKFYSNFSKNNIEYVQKNKETVNKSYDLDIESFIKDCIVNKGGIYYFLLNKFYLYFFMSESWHLKRIKDNKLKSMVNYEGLKKFFKSPLKHKNKFLHCIRSYCMFNAVFDLDSFKKKLYSYKEIKRG